MTPKTAQTLHNRDANRRNAQEQPNRLLLRVLGRVLAAGVIILLSCNRLVFDREEANTATGNFNLLWTVFDERYCFFTEKNVDWDSVYRSFSRQMEWLEDADPRSPDLFHLMADMLETLTDGHVVLADDYFSRAYTGWYAGYPDNFDMTKVNSYYNRNTLHLNNQTSLTVLNTGDIGYIRCGSFAEKFNRHELDRALAQFKGLQGVIIDVRGNGGGLVSEAYMLASRFAESKTHVGYARYKTGKGHNDFSKFFARYVEPDGEHPFHQPVVVLTNRRVYSAANLFVSIMSSLPQVCTMGDRTGGGGGVPLSAELYNGWTVELSANPVFDVNRKSIESGIDPDYAIALDDKTIRNDNMIESAKKWIQNKSTKLN